ncbi:MAG: hypothetical protein JOZ85_16395 [Betaproteobacteria bacterium]|nr:hypothetical protein [Betaproteobacteria bacterium]
MLGKAAVTIWCDVAAEIREEFDHWHAHEHMPERLSIPGFRRGSRWVSADRGSYFICYELESENTLTSSAYLERLNNPTAWSKKMMPHHRNMVRGLCRVEASSGTALGQVLLTVRSWNATTLDLNALAARKGVVAAHLLRAIAQPPPQTAEQKLRGGDATPDVVALVTGYHEPAVKSAAVAGATVGLYRLAYVLS